MKIIIIGSKGFIGSHILWYLTDIKKYDCWGCDVVVDHVHKRYFYVDAMNADYGDIFKGNHFDFCINCSGAASVPDSLINPMRDFSLNAFGVVKILDAIRKYDGKCRFINMSSAAVYGETSRLPIFENDELNPVSPYGNHKMVAEEICSEYLKYWCVECASLRLFSAYGPGLRKQVLWDIFQKTKGSEVVSLWGNGEETRDFVYVDDIALAVAILIEKGQFQASIYNVASGRDVSIRYLAETLLKALAYPGRLEWMGKERQGDPVKVCASINKIRELGYSPRYSIEQGVGKYVEWLQEENLL